MKKTILLIVLAALCPFLKLTAQNNTHPRTIVVNGKVVDEQGNPLPGATVKLKLTNNGVITDKEGKFTISHIPAIGTLTISFIGYQTANVNYDNNQNEFSTIQLKADANSLNEVQVIGYGTTTKRLNTGSVSIITTGTIEQQPITNVLEALSGQAPGVFVQTNNGLPGGDISVTIRGKGSLTAGTNPLYIVDGVPYPSTSLVYNSALGLGINGSINPLNSLNPGDIESISILKDADATAIYGSRGANGVILITTKKGKSGKVRTTLNISHGTSQVANLPDLLNLKDYLQIRREAFKNDGLVPSSDPTSPSYAPDLTVWDTTKSTNWAKYMLGKTASFNDVQASVSGGDDQNSFIISSNYRTASSVLPGDNRYQRGGMHMSVQHVSPDKKFNISMSASYTQDNNLLANPVTNISYDILLPPDFPIYNPNGSLNWAYGANPIADFQNYSKIETDNIVVNATLGYTLLPGLQIKTNIGLNNRNMKQDMVYPASAQNPAYNPSSYTYFGNNDNKSFIVEPQLTYDLKVKRSSLNILLGGTWQKTESSLQNIYATNFNSESLLENLSSASTIIPSNSNLEYKYASIFGRVTYNWDSKYLLNASIRRDGSSRFGPGDQYGNFGAIGAGWIFSSEKWLKDIPWLSYGKLRGSYGITGNDQINDYQYLSTYQSSNYTYQNHTGLTPYTVANADFHWESNKKLEVGLELGFIADRLLITVDRYQSRSGNQLVNYSTPYITGFSNYEANLPAVIQNTGWEFEINSKNIHQNNFSWTTTFNLTTSKNILESFPGLATSGYSNYYVIGESTLRAYGFKYLGADPKTGASLYQLKTGGSSSNPSFDNYYQTMGNLNPSLYGGLGNTFTYKNISLQIFFQYARQYMAGGLVSPGAFSNDFAFVTNRWQNPGDITQIPKPSTYSDFYYTLSSANFFNASYIRLKNVSLSYNVPKAWSQKIGIDQLRLYAQGENLLTWWNKNVGLYDPESGASTNVPPLRTITMGIQITF